MGLPFNHFYDPLLFFFGIGMVGVLVRSVRRLSNPLYQRSMSEPVVFQARVWVRYLRGNWFNVTIFDRWQIAVKTTSFQMTNSPLASTRRRRRIYSAADATMWTRRIDDRDCIVLSHISPVNQKETRWAFCAESENEPAWNALSAAGVRAVPAPADAI
jgi:hypothetical protein